MSSSTGNQQQQQPSSSSSSNNQPGYLPDYQGDKYTNPKRIQETQALNKQFFDSIGGAPPAPPTPLAGQGQNVWQQTAYAAGPYAVSGNGNSYSQGTQNTAGASQQYAQGNGYSQGAQNTAVTSPQYAQGGTNYAQYSQGTNGQGMNSCCGGRRRRFARHV